MWLEFILIVNYGRCWLEVAPQFQTVR
jgi:hypothetical protein